jgi:hypothetical protein
MDKRDYVLDSDAVLVHTTCIVANDIRAVRAMRCLID